MTDERTPTASADEERVRVELDGETVVLAPNEAEAFRNELDEAIERVGPRKVMHKFAFVDGVGSQTAQHLAEEFGTVSAIREASDEELEALPGVGVNMRQRIREGLERESTN